MEKLKLSWFFSPQKANRSLSLDCYTCIATLVLLKTNNIISAISIDIMLLPVVTTKAKKKFFSTCTSELSAEEAQVGAFYFPEASASCNDQREISKHNCNKIILP